MAKTDWSDDPNDPDNVVNAALLNALGVEINALEATVATLSTFADLFLVQFGNSVRAVGTGDFATGFYVGRAFTATKIVYQFDTVDGVSTSTSIQLNRNGSLVSSSNITVSAANQADGTGTDAARSATINQAYSIGDRIGLSITAVPGTPGKGLRAYIQGHL